MTIGDSYKSSLGYKAINQVSPSMRNQGQKQVLNKILTKLNNMNGKLNLDTQPSSNEYDMTDNLNMSHTNTLNLKRQSSI